MEYEIKVAGLTRKLPICPVNEGLSIAAFVIFGDVELTVACARELLKLVPADRYDYLLTAEAKSIPLIHEMARQSGAATAADAGTAGRTAPKTAMGWSSMRVLLRSKAKRAWIG